MSTTDVAAGTLSKSVDVSGPTGMERTTIKADTRTDANYCIVDGTAYVSIFSPASSKVRPQATTSGRFVDVQHATQDVAGLGLIKRKAEVFTFPTIAKAVSPTGREIAMPATALAEAKAKEVGKAVTICGKTMVASRLKTTEATREAVVVHVRGLPKAVAQEHTTLQGQRQTGHAL